MAAPSPIHIGVDFDNTIVAYDNLFRRIACEQGLVPDDFPAVKSEIRDYLRSAGKEPAWTAMQGLVYGPRIAEAEPFPGVTDFFSTCARAGIPVSIISHKTKTPIVGKPFDLHNAALRWLDLRGFLELLPRKQIHFELTRKAKLDRIREAHCSHFIDDLPEVLEEPQFPASVQKILFDPKNAFSPVPGILIARSWKEICDLFRI